MRKFKGIFSYELKHVRRLSNQHSVPLKNIKPFNNLKVFVKKRFHEEWDSPQFVLIL